MELMFFSVNLYLYLINHQKVMLGDQKEYVPSLMGKSKNSIIDVVSIIISVTIVISEIKIMKPHSLCNVMKYRN